MKTKEQVDEAAESLCRMMMTQRGLGGLDIVQCATLCGMVSALTWVIEQKFVGEDGEDPQPLQRLLDRGFIPTPEMN
jgi:hypothetical protein